MSLTLDFRHIPGIFRTHSAIFILVQALRTQAYLGTFRISHTQVYSKRCTQHLGRFKVIQSPSLFRHVMFQVYSSIFTQVIVTHIELYLPTLGLRSVQSNVKKYLLFKSSSFFKSLFKSIWNIFHFSKNQHLTIFSSGQYFNNNNNNNNMQPKLARHPRQHEQHAISQTSLKITRK